jgi:hypothetical protein
MAATPSWLMPTNAGAFPYETTPDVGAQGTTTAPDAARGVSAPYQYNAGLEAPQAVTDLTVLYSKHVVDMVTIPRAPATDDIYKYYVLQGSQVVNIPNTGSGAASAAIPVPLGVVLADGVTLTRCLIPPAYLQKKTWGFAFGRQDGGGAITAGDVVPTMPVITVTAALQAASQGLGQPYVFLPGDPAVATATNPLALVGLQLVASGTGADAASRFVPGFQIKFYNGTGATINAQNAVINYRICFPVPANNV